MDSLKSSKTKITDNNSLSDVEARVKPDFGGEPLKLTGKDLDDLIEIIEIYCRNGYKDLYSKLLKKKLQMVRNISQNSV